MPDNNIFSPVIVIYNQKCADSPSCTKLVELGYPPIIVDNSTADMGNEEYCTAHGMKYINMGGNAGLPKAYNKAIEYVMSATNGSEHSSYIVWFDDDTVIPDNYFDCIISGEGQIFAPVVKSIGADRIISPCVINPKKCGEFKALGENEIDSLPVVHSAINSGLCVNVTVYEGYRYDENMFLDFIDHDFAKSMLERGINMTPAYNVVLRQNFSSDENQSLEKKLARNKLFRKDYLFYTKKWGISSVVAKKRVVFGYLAIVIKELLQRK